MKTLAYIPLHYGKEYLEYSIKSVVDSVDEILILYSSKPTFGHVTTIKNPDSYEDIRSIVYKFSKVKWMNVAINGEGNHRDMAINYAKGKFDIVLAVDSDEVWKPDTIEPCIKQAYDGKERRYATNHQGWHHFYRSFNEVCRDGFEPIRLTNMKVINNDQGRVTDNVIYHFGYANCEKLQEYKMAIHGHKGEISGNWFAQKWLNYRKGETEYLHPASKDIWKLTELFDKNTLPYFMKEHPYYNLSIIK